MFLDLIILCWVLAPDAPSGHQCTAETSWITCALLHCSTSRYQDGLNSPWKPEPTTGRRLHIILLPDQEVHSRHPQYHDIGWASNPDLWTLSWFITLHILLSHTKGLLSFLSFLPCYPVLCFHGLQHSSNMSYPTTSLWSWWDHSPAAAPQTSNSSCLFPML